ncbi:DUF397 domain-containing protein [Streptomyces sp. NBC_01187]|uniref:DUF397 domain-containing protein n=1 Tax=Streptomyces sp. NBC_01187 TaxID=2903766 RepID=UPI00386E331A|nr:DUF397 domain-containing protein [Streptomyces sp. NBC_01187]
MTQHTAPELAPESAWFKSSYSQENGTACVEVADLTAAGLVGIRDSKDETGPALMVPATQFTALIAAIRSRHFDA